MPVNEQSRAMLLKEAPVNVPGPGRYIMALTWDEANAMIEDAESTIREVEYKIQRMARLVGGKLEANCVSPYTLCKLKKELRRYNMHTNTWKD